MDLDEMEMARVGAEFGGSLRRGDVVYLVGDLGAGKTTLAKAILAGCGHAGEVPSPTFTLVQTYDGRSMRVPVLHADLYRLEHPEEAEELGLDDALRDSALLIEWPDRGGGHIPPPTHVIRIEIAAPGRRRLIFDAPEGWEAA